MKIDYAGFTASLKEGGYISGEGQVLLRTAIRGPRRRTSSEEGRIDGFPEAALRAFDAQPECGVAILSTAPFSLAAARTGRSLPAFLDDLAQMAGRAVHAVRDFEAVRGRWAGRRAVLVRDIGCLCLGEDFYEAFAMAMVAEKGALAWAASSALGGGTPIGFADAALMRAVYALKYGRRRAWKGK